MWHWLLAIKLLVVNGDAHGPGRWHVEGRPVLRPSNGPLGWRMAMHRYGESARRYLHAVNDMVGEPLYKANALLNWECGKACWNSTCSTSLGTGMCDLHRLFRILTMAMNIVTKAQDTFEPEFQKVCAETFQGFERSVALGLGHPVETARRTLDRASGILGSLMEEFQSLLPKTCTMSMAQVLFANVDLSSLGLEMTSLLDHQMIIESCAEDVPLTLPKEVQHRSDLGLHHNDIVVSLLLKLLHQARSQGRQDLAMVEVGTAEAEFTVYVLRHVPQVITIDPWFQVNGSSGSLQATAARRALEPWNSRVSVLQMTGEKAAALLADSAYDLVFIDSGEERDGDVISFLPKVRPGGILCGHDFYKTRAYTRTILASVPEGKALHVGPDWMWWFEV